MVRQKIGGVENKSPEDRSEGQLVKEVRPLLEQSQKVISETNSTIRGTYPDHRFTGKVKRRSAKPTATPQEQRLAQALRVLIEVQGTIDWAKGKLEKYPNAKKDLGPLLDALGREYTCSHIYCSGTEVSDPKEGP
ncbi:hypothetical protein BKA70DRAFT_399266 [Coprinopsis sp. MPI-PUGE-AT-0042]|nr:hypothetical protein BKA70DRAFT_399266 [Coprinopsis sp. MPI-PUGE-AT-0042]